MKRAPFLITLLAVLPLTACGSTQSAVAPSLAKRPYEGRFDVPVQPVPVAPPGALPAALGERLARWDAALVKAQSQFSAQRGDAVRLVGVANGAAQASEAWVVAQQAISRLVAARAPLTDAIAELDKLYLERSAAEEFDGMPEVYALRERMLEADSAQQAILESLNASLK